MKKGLHDLGLNKMFASFSAKKTIKAMCDTYTTAISLNPNQNEKERVREVIDARYRLMPLNEEEETLFCQNILLVENLHDACLFVILLEAGVPQGKAIKLEEKLNRKIAEEIKTNL